MAKNDKKENIIGKIIYGFLMFSPLLAIVTGNLYSIFNKNATENTTRTKIQQPTELIQGNIYTIDFNKTNFTTQKRIYYTEIIEENITYYSETPSANIGQWFDYRTNLWLLAYGNKYYSNVKGSLTFRFANAENGYEDYLPAITEKVEYTEERDLRNTYYYTLDKVAESEYFNWVETTDIHTGIKTVTDSLNINNRFTPLILTYWLIMSLVYFIYDMVLMILNLVHKKIHEVQAEL